METRNLWTEEDLLVDLGSANTVAEARAAFEKHNLSLNDDVTDEVIGKALATGNEELSEDDLEEVSGGIAVGLALAVCATFGLAAGEVSFILSYAKRALSKMSLSDFKKTLKAAKGDLKKLKGMLK